ncbi:MAG: DUF433 domain-containing protein [Bacteroidota bacterium]
MNYRDHIGINQNIRFGKPIILGTRISVYEVLNWLSNGMTKSEILEDFPELSIEKINACLAFAAHRENRIRVA